MLIDGEAFSVTAALTDVMRWLADEGIAGTIVGGVAASILGRPRMTRDIDALILAEDTGWDRLVGSAAAYGIAPRIDGVVDFAARTRVLLLRHQPSGVDVDVMLGALTFHGELVARSTLIDVGPLRVRIPSPEDLVIMKAVARRPRDMADIESILSVQRGIDLDRVRQKLREFSSLLEMPEIHEEFEQLLRRTSGSHRTARDS
ncbi:MAG TPA: nucleotidyl transferase AbiEii/AbiGii toxin family protein [Thermoanaerobaculia bacterium]|jgi:predicted nucleotidyltransferase|nr:nucleotidyl transferase AbiEii/AbiGii toxin family protein [Thermoanaerobaculia bacterium]